MYFLKDYHSLITLKLHCFLFILNEVANVQAVAYMNPSEKGAGRNWLEQGQLLQLQRFIM